MGDVGDVEQAEGDGRAGGDAGVKSAEQKPGHDRVRKEIKGEHGRRLPGQERRGSSGPPRRSHHWRAFAKGVTRSPVLMARQRRVNSSITVSTRNRLPSSVQSCMKS
jgi:hypothetical protein